MNPSLNKPKLKTDHDKKKQLSVDLKEISSLDEIPQFDNAEDEARFWSSHAISKELLDQIPEPPTEED